MSFPRYSAYKESKNDWVAHVPEHWELMPCRGFVDERTEKNEDAACQSYLSLMANVGIIPYEEKGDIGNKKPEDLSKCKIVCQGDFVINSMNYGIGSYGVSAYEGVCSPVYIVLTPRQDVVEPRFAFRVFEDKSFQAYAQSLGNGILAHRCAIGWDDLKGIVVGIPSAAEQKSILNFLDRETAKIDALIAEQQRLIELLQEKRQAVISHAVTKGLNPNAPMKDSGVDWLGEVPEHWEVLPAGRVCQIFAPQRDKPELNTTEDGYPWITLENIKNGNIVNLSAWVSIDAAKEAGARPLAAGSVIASCIGNFGISTVTKEASVINQQLQAYRPGDKVNAQFLQNAIMSSRSYFEAVCTTSTLSYVNKSGFWGLLIALPPKEEQNEIASVVSQRALDLDNLIALSVQTTVLLQERRSALISAAVTGQIDVRGLVETEAGKQ